MTFHGHVDEEAIPATYRRFDVLAVPSVPMPGWLEQFGRVVVEAQASGIPVVASASGALPDVVGEAGLLVPPRDPGRPPRRAGPAARRARTLGAACGERASTAPAATRGTSVAEAQMDLYRTAAGAPARPDYRTGTPAPRGPPVGRWPSSATDRPGRGPPGGRRGRASGEPLLLAVAQGASHRGRRSAGSRPRRTSAARRRLGVTGWEEEPVLAHGLEVGAAGGRHHGDAVGHGLDHREPERLGRSAGPGRRTPRASSASVSATCADEIHAARDAELARPGRSSAGSEGPGAGHHQPPAPVGPVRCSAKARIPTSGAFSASRRCSITTVGAASGAWGRSATPLGITREGAVTASATNWLMAMSQTMDRTGHRGPGPGPDVLDPRSAGEVPGGHDGGPVEGSGQPGRALGRGHVDVDEVGGAGRRPGPRPPTAGTGPAGWVDARAAKLGPHPAGVPADGEHLVAAAGQLVGHLADVALHPGEGVGDHHVDRPDSGRSGRSSSAAASTRQGPCR